MKQNKKQKTKNKKQNKNKNKKKKIVYLTLPMKENTLVSHYSKSFYQNFLPIKFHLFLHPTLCVH